MEIPMTVGNVLAHKQRNLGKEFTQIYTVTVHVWCFIAPNIPDEASDARYEMTFVHFIGDGAQEMAEGCFKAVAGGLLEQDVSDAIYNKPYEGPYGGYVEVYDDEDEVLTTVSLHRDYGYI